MPVRFGDRRTHVLDQRQSRTIRPTACGGGTTALQTRAFNVAVRNQRQRRQMDVPVNVVDGLYGVIQKVEQESESHPGRKREYESQDDVSEPRWANGCVRITTGIFYAHLVRSIDRSNQQFALSLQQRIQILFIGLD